MRYDKEKTEKNKRRKTVAAMILFLCVAVLALYFGNQLLSKENATDPYAGKDPVDMSEYDSMKGENVAGADSFVDTDVKEIARLKDAGETFVFIASYTECGYCDRLMPYLAKVAEEKGRKVGYLNTRKDPSWQSNVDIDDYDVFVDMFDFYLQKEDSGYHLYTPDIYFIKNGGVVANHKGVIEGADDLKLALTDEQEEALLEELREDFDKME